MEKIIINGLELFAYHGVNPEEKQDGQRFTLDLCLMANLAKAKESDLLVDTVNYAAIVKTIAHVFTETSYDLLERAGKVVCDAIFKAYPQIDSIELTLKKPHAPIEAVFSYVAIVFHETREANSNSQKKEG